MPVKATTARAVKLIATATMHMARVMVIVTTMVVENKAPATTMAPAWTPIDGDYSASQGHAQGGHNTNNGLMRNKTCSTGRHM